MCEGEKMVQVLQESTNLDRGNHFLRLLSEAWTFPTMSDHVVESMICFRPIIIFCIRETLLDEDTKKRFVEVRKEQWEESKYCMDRTCNYLITLFECDFFIFVKL